MEISNQQAFSFWPSLSWEVSLKYWEACLLNGLQFPPEKMYPIWYYMMQNESNKGDPRPSEWTREKVSMSN